MEIFNIISAYITDWLQWWITPLNATQLETVNQAWLPVAMAIAGLAAQGVGMYQKAQANKKLQEKQEGINNRMQSLTDWYEGEASKDFMDTEIAQSTLGRIRDQYKEALEVGGDNMAKMGSTAESKVAHKGLLQDKYNKTVSNLAGYGTQYKRNLNRDYSRQLSGLFANNAATFGPEVQSWDNFLNNAGNLTGASVQAGDWDFLNKKDKEDNSN